MQMYNIAGIAIALAMDAFAVAISAGATLKQISFRQFFRLSWHFGLFQAMMPVFGWSAGIYSRVWIEAFDHWVAFGLLVFVAQGMLRSGLKKEKTESDIKDPTKGITMVMLSLATSIDALAVGFSLAAIDISIWIPALIIGIVAGMLTVIGMHLGVKIGKIAKLTSLAEILGGIVLFLIGLNILRAHGAL